MIRASIARDGQLFAIEERARLLVNRSDRAAPVGGPFTASVERRDWGRLNPTSTHRMVSDDEQKLRLNPTGLGVAWTRSNKEGNVVAPPTRTLLRRHHDELTKSNRSISCHSDY